MTYKIRANWHKPMYLRDGYAENLIYMCEKLEDVPNSPGVSIQLAKEGDNGVEKLTSHHAPY